MDSTTEALVTYVTEFSPDSITPSAKASALTHLVDAIAVVIAGFNTPPVHSAVRVARHHRSDAMATVLGWNLQTSAPYAAFTNTVMIRCLDWNDGMFANGGGHPSDMLGGVLAAGEVNNSSGHDVLMSMIIAYEILGSMAVTGREGFDHGTFMGMATALAAGRLYGLNKEELANALSLSIVPHIPLLVTRRGELSMWKGAATGVATQSAIMAIELAKAGMTGPGRPFADKCGVFEKVTTPFDVQIPRYPSGKFIVEISHMKMFPSEAHSQATLGLLPKILAWTTEDEIETIDIESYFFLYNAIGRDESCWDPKTRESADHSLPYLLAVGLMDGDVTLDSFTPERIADPALRPIMAKVRIRENPEFTAGYRPPGQEIAASPRVHIVIRKKTGEVFDEIVTYPKGHSLNPMSVADVNSKFAKTCDGVLSNDQRDAIQHALWNIEKAPTIVDVLRLMADFHIPFPE